jgi:hypothetical protein
VRSVGFGALREDVLVGLVHLDFPVLRERLVDEGLERPGLAGVGLRLRGEELANDVDPFALRAVRGPEIDEGHMPRRLARIALGVEPRAGVMVVPPLAALRHPRGAVVPDAQVVGLRDRFAAMRAHVAHGRRIDPSHLKPYDTALPPHSSGCSSSQCGQWMR